MNCAPNSLSAALGIVRGHQGGIDVRSEVGLGTCVRVLFPVSTGSVIAKSAQVTEVRVQDRLVGTVLVVDDEEMVLAVSSEILRRHGMRVVSASDGVEAIAAFKQYRAEITVVLLDLTMPRMDGRCAAAEIERIDPTMPVILMSGFDEAEAIRKFASTGFGSFLQKPFTAAALVEIVQRIVSQREPSRMRQEQLQSSPRPIDTPPNET